jgi:sugar phosphate isomerase/epimerase
MSRTGFDRRNFLARSMALAGASAIAVTAPAPARAAESAAAPVAGGAIPPRQFHLGMVTYNMGKDMTVPQLSALCKAAGLEGVELRTTHKHGVEPTLTADQRAEVRKTFEGSGVLLVSLGTTCEFHASEPAAVKKNIEECAQFCRLAKDVGARGVKVRPNGLVKGKSNEESYAQIGGALAECGKSAADNGVEIWLEVHGGAAHPPHIRGIMDACKHPKVGACWNSNAGDVKDGSVKEYFMLLRPNLLSCHITEIYSDYPYRELFTLMRQTGYDRFTLAEIPESTDPVRVMKYYRGLWKALSE